MMADLIPAASISAVDTVDIALILAEKKLRALALDADARWRAIARRADAHRARLRQGRRSQAGLRFAAPAKTPPEVVQQGPRAVRQSRRMRT